jgi:hypothetical protein
LDHQLALAAIRDLWNFDWFARVKTLNREKRDRQTA